MLGGINNKNSIMYARKTLIYTRLVDTQYNPLHKHYEWEIIIPISGKTIHRINDQPHELLQNEILISKPYDYHSIENISTETYSHFDLYLTDSLMKQICDFSSKGIWSVLSQSTKPMTIQVSSEYKKVIIDQLNELLPLQQTTPQAPYTLSLYHSLLFSLISKFICNAIKMQEKLPDWLYQLVNNVHKSIYEGKSVEDAISQTHYTHGRLCVLFKQHMDCTLISYITSVRMDYAKNLIKNKDLNILEICNLVGYDSLSHFIKLFKNHTGYTPKQYRKKVLLM